MAGTDWVQVPATPAGTAYWVQRCPVSSSHYSRSSHDLLLGGRGVQHRYGPCNVSMCAQSSHYSDLSFMIFMANFVTSKPSGPLAFATPGCIDKLQHVLSHLD